MLAYKHEPRGSGPRARIAEAVSGTLRVVVLAGPARGRVVWVTEEHCR